MRTQFTDESYTSIIEDVLYLCKKANKNVPQRDKLRYMLKEINEEALGLVLLVNLPFLSQTIIERSRLQQRRNRCKIFGTRPHSFLYNYPPSLHFCFVVLFPV